MSEDELERIRALIAFMPIYSQCSKELLEARRSVDKSSRVLKVFKTNPLLVPQSIMDPCVRADKSRATYVKKIEGSAQKMAYFFNELALLAKVHLSEAVEECATIRLRAKNPHNDPSFDWVAFDTDCSALARAAQATTQSSNPHNPDPVATALGVLSKHPNWSQNKIAKEVGVSASTLSRSRMFKIGKATANNVDRIHRGNKPKDGVVEAVDEE